EPALPPLVKRGCARRRRRRSKDNMKKCDVINRRFCSEVKADRSREQHQQSKARLDQFGEIRRDPPWRRCEIRILGFDRGSFHVRTGSPCGAPGGRALPNVGCKIRQQLAEMLTPKDSMTAPTATCAVATSAALLLQI